jgi:DMSO/TMAO reductase YedYZ molybdopterin-dependent catalytic subunit
VKGWFVLLYSPQLITRKIAPENQEFPIFSIANWITPEHLFFIRNHFMYPVIDMRSWYISIEGCVNKPDHFTYQNLIRMPQITLPVTLECAGDKRALFHPKTRGEQWELGAISHAVWTGVPLKVVLDYCGIQQNAIEVVFEALDHGERTDMPGIFSYSRSLPLKEAMHLNTIIALYLNGKPLPYRHGFPARLIVPGWYGMASVKWLHRILVTDRPFTGPFQTVDYVSYKDESDTDGQPVNVIKVNSTVARPSGQEILPRGEHWIVGVAWSGVHPVVQVHVSPDGGGTWNLASWLDPALPSSWRRWSWKWNASHAGPYDLMVKATDAAGNTQSVETDWNKKGYANNAIHKIRVYVD